MAEPFCSNASTVARLPIFDVDRVVVMDDDTDTRHLVRDIITKFGGTVLEAVSEKDVLDFAERFRARNFILDIHMGDDRSSEGLDTLERLKAYDPDIFVGMLSNHPNRFRQMAEALDCDVFREKTSNRLDDIRFILGKMLEIREANLERAREAFALGTGDAELLEPVNARAGENPVGGFADPNLRALSLLLGDQHWVSAHRSMYVVLVDGEVVEVGENKSDVMERARKRFPNKNRLLELISGPTQPVEIWSPFSVE